MPEEFADFEGIAKEVMSTKGELHFKLKEDNDPNIEFYSLPYVPPLLNGHYVIGRGHAPVGGRVDVTRIDIYLDEKSASKGKNLLHSIIPQGF